MAIDARHVRCHAIGDSVKKFTDLGRMIREVADAVGIVGFSPGGRRVNEPAAGKRDARVAGIRLEIRRRPDLFDSFDLSNADAGAVEVRRDGAEQRDADVVEGSC